MELVSSKETTIVLMPVMAVHTLLVLLVQDILLVVTSGGIRSATFMQKVL
jgi:hypothetical protein